MTDLTGGAGRLPADEPYAPYDLVLDEARLGMSHTTVRSAAGSCVARHRPERTSEVATVFLHGAAGAWTTWTPLLAAADDAGLDLSDAVLLDLPGWGDAELTTHPREITIEQIADLVARTLTELGYAGWHIVGHSLGGFIGMHLAGTRVAEVRSVAMVSGTTFSVMRSVEHPLARFFELPGFTMLWQVLRFFGLFGSGGTALVQLAGRTGVLRTVFGPLFSRGARIPQSLISATAHDLRPAAFAAAAQVARGYDAGRWWGGIRCPVIAVKGDRDVFVTDADLADLGRLLPHSSRFVLEECGHFANVERPATLLRALGWTAR